MREGLRIGVDCDGVLADFNEAFIQRTIDVTGVDLYPPRPFDIPCWDYPEHYGYTAAQTSAIWATIKQDPYFWQRLRHLPDAVETVRELDWRQWNYFDEIYYVTARPGVRVRFQTETWLEGLSASYTGHKTVLISSHKGLVARALELDVYIDDKWENCLDVIAATTPANNPERFAPKTKVFMLNQPWNRGKSSEHITRVDSPFEVIDYIEQSSLLPV